MTERQFPILWQGSCAYMAGLEKIGCPRTVPWGLVESCSEQLRKNHGQTVDRLAERGGLSVQELAGALLGKGVGYVMHMNTAAAVAQVVSSATAYQKDKSP